MWWLAEHRAAPARPHLEIAVICRAHGQRQKCLKNGQWNGFRDRLGMSASRTDDRDVRRPIPGADDLLWTAESRVSPF